MNINIVYSKVSEIFYYHKQTSREYDIRLQTFDPRMSKSYKFTYITGGKYRSFQKYFELNVKKKITEI